MKKFKTLIIIFLLCACSLGGSETRPLYPPFMPAPPEGGPQEFQQGWADGCDTGMSAHGTDVFRSSMGFIQNPEMAQNPIYYKAWKDAENYCRTYIYEYSIRSGDVYCSLDGMTSDCGDTLNKTSVPLLGGSTDTLGYKFLGGGSTTSDETLFGGGQRGISGIGPIMGDVSADRFLGKTTGEDSIFGF